MNHEPSNSLLGAAQHLAAESAKSGETIKEVYLFPAEDEIRLIEIDEIALPSPKEVLAFYFAPDPNAGIPYPSGIAIIRPSEFGKISLPEGWGEWSDAKLIYAR